MLRMLARRLWRDDDGFVVSSELVLWGTIMAVATVVGVMSVRIAVVNVFMGQAEGIASKQTTDLTTLANVVLYCPYNRGILAAPGNLGTNSGGGMVVPSGPES